MELIRVVDLYLLEGLCGTMQFNVNFTYNSRLILAVHRENSNGPS